MDWRVEYSLVGGSCHLAQRRGLGPWVFSQNSKHSLWAPSVRFFDMKKSTLRISSSTDKTFTASSLTMMPEENSSPMGDNSEQSGSSSSSSPSSVSNLTPPGSPTKKKVNFQEVQGAVKKESNRVNLLRTFLLLSILGVGAAISTLTYKTLTKELNGDAADAVSFFSTCLPSYTRCNLSHILRLSLAAVCLLCKWYRRLLSSSSTGHLWSEPSSQWDDYNFRHRTRSVLSLFPRPLLRSQGPCCASASFFWGSHLCSGCIRSGNWRVSTLC